MVKALTAAGLAVLAGGPAFAQSEQALRSALVGREVVVKVDMPATEKGFDLRFERAIPLDPKEQSDRMRTYKSIAAGERVPITFIKVKGDLIEFHLAGGGAWSSATKSVSINLPTKEENEVEAEIKVEKDTEKKRRLERELSRMQRERARDHEREQREVEEWNVKAIEIDRERVLHAGSRFNLRFKKRVPADALTADGIQRYLDPWVDFSAKALVGAPIPTSRSPKNALAGTSTATAVKPTNGWRKGALRRDLEDTYGAARAERSCRGDFGGFDCKIVTLADGSEEVEATFVEGVLISYSSRRK